MTHLKIRETLLSAEVTSEAYYWALQGIFSARSWENKRKGLLNMNNSVAQDLQGHHCTALGDALPACRLFFIKRLFPSILFFQPHQLLPQLKETTLPHSFTPGSTHPAFKSYSSYKSPPTLWHSSYFQPKCPLLWWHNKWKVFQVHLLMPFFCPWASLGTSLSPSSIPTTKAHLPLQKRYLLQRYYTNT